jgi:cytochrome c-type biogenesis protein CcmF
MDNQFIGEHLLPGQFGQLFVVVSFVAALFSCFSYFNAARTEKDLSDTRTWTMFGRVGFGLHAASVLGIFGALYYVIANHLFEYHYAWEHSSFAMPGKYLLSCFWEGQQGSFMLWSFWHCVLGLIVMRTSGKLETRVMAIIALVEVCIASMLLGIYFGNAVKVGVTPFDLLRHAMQNAPIFSQPNYMEFIKDGNGLNVLLQNYWMVIHPPVLFLGFATTLIPFAYVVAALWKGEYEAFSRPALVWALFNGAVLGTGIMMGGAWAYESLNFGGYWAWDPVENASLVPWLTLIAAIHTLLSYRSTGRALPATLLLFLLTHLLVWYSTFLTRTGVLGNTSVHAFTGDGTAMFYHLLAVIGILLVQAASLWIWRSRTMPKIKTEEALLSREFWMFVGAVVLFISATHISIMTSIPVWSPLAKWMTGKDVSLIDPMSHYNNVEVWIAVLIGLLAASSLFLKYRNTDAKTIAKQLAWPALVALMLTVLIAVFQKIGKGQYVLMLFSAVYAMTASVFHVVGPQKMKFSKAGASIAHLGFGMVLLGILLSSYNKQVLSNNTSGMVLPFNKKTEEENIKESMENIILYKNRTDTMGEYLVTYTGDSTENGKDLRVYYLVNFERNDSKSNTKEHFTLYPDAFINPKGMQGLSANPSTKHYWDRDIFTFINAVQNNKDADTATFRSQTVTNQGDTVFLEDGFMLFNGFSKVAKNDSRFHIDDSDLGVTASLAVFDHTGSFVKDISPVYLLKNRKSVESVEDTVESMSLHVKFNLKVLSGDKAEAQVMFKESRDNLSYIVLKVLVFPFINVLWLGVIMMVFGFFVSIGNRLQPKSA